MADDTKKSTDPFLGFKFWVQIDGVNVAGFTECSPITVETEVLEYAEGGNNGFNHKLAGRMKWGNITLKHGIDPGGDLLFWYNSSHQDMPNRKNISIILYNHDGSTVQTYHLLAAYPVKWTSPDLRSDPAAVAIETIEIAHHGMDLTQDKGKSGSGQSGAVASAASDAPYRMA